MLNKIFSYRQLFIFIHGLSSGLPLLLTLGTLQAWMTDANVDLGTIGLISSVTLPYSLKFLWSPLLDRFVWPFLGRRKGWILVAQLAVAASIALLAMLNPANNIWFFSLAALLITFFSATQDTLIDAYRREILPHEELGFGSSMYIGAYRVGMLLSGALALKLADHWDDTMGLDAWRSVYLLMALIMVIIALISIFAPREDTADIAPKSLREAVVGPLKDFFKRDGVWTILAFILLYKLGDQMASTMTTPFILQKGYTKSELADIAKIFGMAATIGGGFLGGILMMRIDIYKSLWIFGALQAISTFGFAILAMVPNSLSILASVIAFENLAGGMGTAAYVAYMANLTNKKYTATQYALLTSLMALPRTLFSAPTGYLAQYAGWVNFFVICTVIALPGMLLLLKVAPWNAKVKEA